MTPREKVSIGVLTHNAVRYCRTTLRSLQHTRDVDTEVIVVDNASRWPTRAYLALARRQGLIDHLRFLPRNTFFAAGNNTGVALSSTDASHVLLLNSDVEVRDPLWLRRLLDVHQRGATAYGYVEQGPWPRADGYSFLIDRDLYAQHQLDESYAWWWSLTKLQAQLLADGHSVQAIDAHERWLHHFGGKSGGSWRGAAGMDTPAAVVRGWFAGRHITVLPELSAAPERGP